MQKRILLLSVVFGCSIFSLVCSDKNEKSIEIYSGDFSVLEDEPGWVGSFFKYYGKEAREKRKKDQELIENEKKKSRVTAKEALNLEFEGGARTFTEEKIENWKELKVEIMFCYSNLPDQHYLIV